jgi:hypothetical protein
MMPSNPTLTICFHRNDGHRERIPLRRGTVWEAVEAIQRVFSISDGLYTKAELYKGDELIETVPNEASVPLASILVQ